MMFVLSSRRRHTRCALVTGVQTCALPISLNLPQEIGEVIRDVLEKHNPEWADEFAFTLAVCVLEGNIHTVSNLCPQHQAHMLALGSAAIQSGMMYEELDPKELN